tara:strand:+ start:1219 stop:3423 length:2205 start_codon:yes stop_codon:yes gene_type:complete
MKKFFTIFLLTIFFGLKAKSDNKKKSIEAFSIETEDIKLDGKLDESFWNSISGISDFLVQEPIEGGIPTENTVIKIAYDNKYLYIGAIFYDSDPEGIKAFKMRKDAPLNTDDRFMWILDTYLDGRNAYFFEINPRGLMGDGLLSIGQGRSLNKDWDGIWRPWTHIGDYGWSAEIRIPFHTLNFDPKISSWGINFQRTIRRKNEEILWTGYKRNQGIFRPQDAGLLIGLENISQGLGLELVGYGKAEASKVEKDLGEGYTKNGNIDAGLDINYNITPGLKASLTLNTDFAETEVDDRQINLTRFPIRFPEKRDFFLEGANIFQFAPRSGVYPYFSRKIGLQSGNPVPILFGGRVIGKVGKVEVAAQQVKTRKTDLVNSEDFSVLRLKHNFLKESSIGILYTRRHTQIEEQTIEPIQDRNTFGVDLTLNTSSFLSNKNLQFQAFAILHNPNSLDNTDKNVWDRSARGLRFNFPNQPWSGSLSYREFGLSYDPAVGFSRRNSFRRVEPRIRFSPILEKSPIIRELQWELSFENLMSLGWKKLTQNIRLTPLSIRFESGDEISYQFIRNFERLEYNFNILGDNSIIIPIGNYTNWSHQIEIETANHRKIVYELELISEGFWSGKRTEYQNNLTIRPLEGINLSFGYIYSKVNLKEGNFNTNLIRILGDFDFSPFISFSSNVQYDDISKQIGMNNRFKYTLTPGSDIYFVYNHNWIGDKGKYKTTSMLGATKITYTQRF